MSSSTTLFKTLVLAHALFPGLVPLARAANDWQTPCTNGRCSYESGDGVKSAFSTIDMIGSSATLSDITSAAGWTISNCSADWSQGQANVQLTCTGPSAAQLAACKHVLESGGAVNKVVRLPEECGTGAFARIASWQASGAAESTTFVVGLDYNFAGIPAPSDGTQPLTFTVNAANGQKHAALLRRRALEEFDHARRSRSYPLHLAPRFDIVNNIDATPIEFSKSFTLFNQTFDCPAADGGVGVAGGVNVGADVTLKVETSFGVSLSGDIFPFPKITKFQLTGSLTGGAAATFDVVADATGTFATGELTLFAAGLPGLVAPGLFEIGPEFIVTTELVAALELQAIAKAGVTYTFPKVDLVFPPNAGASAASVTPAPNALSLALAPEVTADGSVTAHLTPKVQFGIKILNGLAEATVFLAVDGNAKLGVSAAASVDLGFDGGDIEPSVNACVGLDAGISVDAGATGAIEPIFNKNVNFNIFKKNFKLFEKCFGKAAGAKRSLPPSFTGRINSAIDIRALACPRSDEGVALNEVLNL